MSGYQNFNTSNSSKRRKANDLREHDVVKVADETRTKEYGIHKGFIGTVVHIYKDGTCEVEFPMVPISNTKVLTIPSNDLKIDTNARPSD